MLLARRRDLLKLKLRLLQRLLSRQARLLLRMAVLIRTVHLIRRGTLQAKQWPLQLLVRPIRQRLKQSTLSRVQRQARTPPLPLTAVKRRLQAVHRWLQAVKRRLQALLRTK